MERLKLSTQLLEDPNTNIFANSYLHMPSKPREGGPVMTFVVQKIRDIFSRILGAENQGNLNLAEEKR